MYPLATSEVPGCSVAARHSADGASTEHSAVSPVNFSSAVSHASSGSRQSCASKMPKIVPVGMPASTFDEPSSGSKTAVYRPVSSISAVVSYAGSPAMSEVSTGLSSSSEAMTPILPVKRSAFLSTPFVTMSSVFCSSPCTLIEPPPSA